MYAQISIFRFLFQKNVHIKNSTLKKLPFHMHFPCNVTIVTALLPLKKIEELKTEEGRVMEREGQGEVWK